MSPLLAASHNSSGGLDAAAAGVGAGWVADDVAPGGGAMADAHDGMNDFRRELASQRPTLSRTTLSA